MRIIFFTSLLICFFTFPIKAEWRKTTNTSTNLTIFSIITKDTNVFIGTNKGFFRSGKNCKNWVNKNKGLTSLNIYSLSICDSNILAGTDDGVFRSNNNGDSWTTITYGITTNSVQALLVYGRYILAGTYDQGIFLTDNNGLNWFSINNYLNCTHVWELTNIGSVIFAATDNGVFKSLDTCKKWIPVNSMPGIEVFSLATNDSIIFAGTKGEGIYLSQNMGETWYRVLNTSVVPSLAAEGELIIAGTLNGIYLSKNNGKNWVDMNLDMPKVIVLAIAIQDSNVFAGSYRNGIFTTINSGLMWQSMNEGLYPDMILSMVNYGSEIIVGTGSNGVFISKDNGDSWNRKNVGLIFPYINVLSICDTNLFAGTYEGIYKTSAYSKEWTALPYSDKFVVYSLLVEGTNIYAGTWDDGIIYSNNDGLNWVQANGISYGTVYSLVSHNNTAYAGFETYRGVYASNDGINWFPSNNGLPDPINVYSLVSNENNIFAGSSNGVFLSKDNGANWKVINDGLPVGGARILLSKGNNIFAGTFFGVYVFESKGESWISINDTELDSLEIWSLTANDKFIFAGTDHDGIWKKSLSEVTGMVNVFQGLEISIFPNPVSSSLNVKYNLSYKPEFIKMEIVDINGKLILSKDIQSLASFSFDIDIHGFKNGLYVCRILTNKEIFSQKIIKI